MSLAPSIERYDADTCLLVILDQSTGGHHLYRAQRHHPEVVGQAEPLTDEAARSMLVKPGWNLPWSRTSSVT